MKQKWRINMVAFIIGILLIAFGVYAVLPFSWALGWGEEVLILLKGGVPLAALVLGLVALAVAFADFQDRRAAGKEEKNRKNS